MCAQFQKTRNCILSFFILHTSLLLWRVITKWKIFGSTLYECAVSGGGHDDESLSADKQTAAGRGDAVVDFNVTHFLEVLEGTLDNMWNMGVFVGFFFLGGEAVHDPSLQSSRAVIVWSQGYSMCWSTALLINAHTQTCSVGHQSTLQWHYGLLQCLCGHLRFR